MDRNLPSSDIEILAINENGQESANDLAASTNDLPLLQDTAAEDAWGNWGAVWRDVHVVDAEGEVTNVMNLTTNDLRDVRNYAALRGMIVDAATSNRVQQSDWQNPVEPLDTNDDGFVAPIDALNIINRINTEGAGELGDVQGEPSLYYDPSGDNFVSSLDALRIIQVLNRFSLGAGEPDESGEPAGEPESGQPASQAVAVDAYFAWNQVEQDDEEEK